MEGASTLKELSTARRREVLSAGSAGSDSRVSWCLKQERTDDYALQLEGLQGLSALPYTKPPCRAHTGQWLDGEQLDQTEPEGDKAMLVAWLCLLNDWGENNHKNCKHMCTVNAL